MSYKASYSNSHSPTATYYLVCDPATGKVVVRAHKWYYELSHYVQLRVTRIVWKYHRAGGELDVSHIHEPDLGKWVAACRRAQGLAQGSARY